MDEQWLKRCWCSWTVPRYHVLQNRWSSIASQAKSRGDDSKRQLAKTQRRLEWLLNPWFLWLIQTIFFNWTYLKNHVFCLFLYQQINKIRSSKFFQQAFSVCFFQPQVPPTRLRCSPAASSRGALRSSFRPAPRSCGRRGRRGTSPVRLGKCQKIPDFQTFPRKKRP